MKLEREKGKLFPKLVNNWDLSSRVNISHVFRLYPLFWSFSAATVVFEDCAAISSLPSKYTQKYFSSSCFK